MPCVSTLKSYKRANNENAGEVEQRLIDERKKYDARVQEHKDTGKKPPLSQGVLILDEVKVAAKLHWNSSNDSLVGHAMTPEDMASLYDLYSVLDDSERGLEKADYIMQTLWRDLSTDLRYTSVGPFIAQSMLACVFDTLRKFHAHGFQVRLVCDGASSNLTMIKLLLGTKGVFPSTTSPFKVPTWIQNPFNGKKLYMIICPTHQVTIIIMMLCVARV